MEDQLSLLESVKKGFEGLPIVEVENKIDIVRTDSRRMKISALSGEGMEDLIAEILSLLRNTKKEAERVLR
jgi:nucleolar GTP-binding protein